MIKECKVDMWNECVMVIDFGGNKIQMPSTKTKEKLVYVKCDSKKYFLVSKDEYEKYLEKATKKDTKKEENINDEE